MGAEATLRMILLGEDRSAGKTLKGVGNEGDRTKSKLQGLSHVAGKVLLGGLLVGGAALVKFGGQASDLAETQSKVAQIFGKDSVDALDKFASGADKSMGQSKQTALDAMATFGMFGKMAKLSGGDLVDFSSKMTTLASDMASFSNTSPEEAIEAIGAAMRGESEPIRKYGVLLDDATLRNEALKLGLIKTTKEALTPQQKVLAAQAAIMHQTSDQQGDFARTSDGLANKQRVLKAEFENMTTQLGAKALPAMVAVVGVGLQMIEWISKNHEVLVPLVAVLGGAVVAVWAINAAARAYAATQAALNIVLSANPIGLVILGLVLLGAALVVAYKKSETFRTIVNGAFHAIGSAFRAVWNNLLAPVFQLWGKAIAVVLSTWAALLRLLGKVPGFGWAKTLADKLDTAADKARNLDLKLRDTTRPRSIHINTSSIDYANAKLDRILSKLATVSAGVLTPALSGLGAAGGHSAVGASFLPGGFEMVGERGPEIAAFPRGTRIFTAADSARAMAGGGGGDLGTLVVVVRDEDGRNMAKKLAKLKRDQGGLKLEFES